MSQPFFDFQNCPDAQGVPVPPAIDRTGLLASCTVPASPDPVFQCPPINLPLPGIFGTILLQIQVTAVTGAKYDWQAVDPDGSGGWVLNGMTGSAAAGSEAYEINGVAVTPGAAVYMGRRVEGSDKVVFWENPGSLTLNDNFRYIKLTAGPDSSGVYDWEEVAPDDWHTTGVTGTAAGGDGAYEQTGFDPIVDGSVYIARKASTGKYVFVAPRRVYMIRLTAGPSSGSYDWASYDPDGSGGWTASGLTGTAAGGHGASERIGQVVPADDATLYEARQDGQGHMIFRAPQLPFWIQLTAGPDGNGKYDWAQVEDDGSGGWSTTGTTGTAAGGDGAREMAGLPAIPGDGQAYLARRAKDGTVVFNTVGVNSGFLAVAPAGGVPAGGSASCQLVDISGASPALLAATATVWNFYPSAMGLNSSLQRPLQVKVVQGKLVIDVDPCAT